MSCDTRRLCDWFRIQGSCFRNSTGGQRLARRRTREFFFSPFLTNEKVTHDRIWNKSLITSWTDTAKQTRCGLMSAGEYSRRQKQLYPLTQMAAANEVLAMEILRATINTCQALHMRDVQVQVKLIKKDLTGLLVPTTRGGTLLHRNLLIL